MKTAYDPVEDDSYISGPGCHVASGWGWTAIIVLGVISALYVGGGIGFGVKTQGASAGISAHPHLDQWKQAVGLVVDGLIFTRAHVEAKLKGEPVVLASTATVDKKQDSTSMARNKTQEATDDGDGETSGLLNNHKETYGAAGTSVDPAAFSAAADEGNNHNVAAAASDGGSSDDDLVE